MKREVVETSLVPTHARPTPGTAHDGMCTLGAAGAILLVLLSATSQVAASIVFKLNLAAE